MSKLETINVSKKTHAYILEDGTVVRAISEAHVSEYKANKIQTYSCDATKLVNGQKTEVKNYYVSIENYIKKQKANSLAQRVESKVANLDLSKMTAQDLLALL